MRIPPRSVKVYTPPTVSGSPMVEAYAKTASNYVKLALEGNPSARDFLADERDYLRRILGQLADGTKRLGAAEQKRLEQCLAIVEDGLQVIETAAADRGLCGH